MFDNAKMFHVKIAFCQTTMTLLGNNGLLRHCRLYDCLQAIGILCAWGTSNQCLAHIVDQLCTHLSLIIWFDFLYYHLLVLLTATVVNSGECQLTSLYTRCLVTVNFNKSHRLRGEIIFSFYKKITNIYCFYKNEDITKLQMFTAWNVEELWLAIAHSTCPLHS